MGASPPDSLAPAPPGLRQEGPGELQGPLRGSKDQGRTGRLGPQPSLSLPPHVLPSHLFKMKNRKAEKQWMGGRELGGCRCGRTRSEDFRPAAHNAARWRERGLGWAFSSQRALKAGGRGQRLMGRRRAGRSSGRRAPRPPPPRRGGGGPPPPAADPGTRGDRGPRSLPAGPSTRSTSALPDSLHALPVCGSYALGPEWVTWVLPLGAVPALQASRLPPASEPLGQDRLTPG